MTDDQNPTDNNPAAPSDVPTGDLPPDEPEGFEGRVKKLVDIACEKHPEAPREAFEIGFALLESVADAFKAVPGLAASFERIADAIEHFNKSNDDLIDYNTRGIK